MSRERSAPSAYLVAWRDAGVVKGGCSMASRWLDHQRRGAVVLGVWPFDTLLAAFDGESLLLRALNRSGPLAFQWKEEALPYLYGGGGYRECYSIAPSMLDDAAEQCRLAMLELCGDAKHVTERTDEQTQTHRILRNQSCDYVTRAPTYGELE